jgi:CRP-like cAMP-binding protein
MIIRRKKEVIIYEYKKVNTLKSNDYFGDSLLETREPLKETIIAEENCDMAVLSNKLYSEQILSEKSVLLDQKISDLHENHFFREIKYGKFSKKYFKLFINEKYKKEDIIFNEGDEVKYLYFIQEGTVELSLNKSINEIEFLIDCLLDKKDIISEDSKSDLRLKDLMKGNYTFGEFLSQQNFNKNSNYIQLPNSNEEIDVNYLNEKQNNKLIILKNNEDFGIISLILGNKYISTSTVTSKTANIYKLDKNHLKMILSHESECEE